MIRITSEDKEKFEHRSWVKLINGLSGFKSVNLVGTRDKNGNENLAIISSFFHLGAAPPLMGFVVRPHSNKSPRHTLLNIKETKHYTLNAVTKDHHLKAHQTSARYPSEISEFEAVGLDSIYKNDFSAPYVKGSPIQIGFKLVEIIDVKHNKTHIIIGEIVEIHLQDGLLSADGFVDLEQAHILTLSGLDSYHTTQQIHRLSYAKPDQEVREI